MQKFRIIQNNSFNNITSDVNSGLTITQGEQLTLSNNYYSYITKNGGETVNDNNVRNFLDKPENNQLAEDFVVYLQNNTTIIEFKEIFYDNKKLANTFNEYYKNNFIENFNENNSIQQSLTYTSEKTTLNNNFLDYQNRMLDQIDTLIPIPITGNSYFVNLKVVNTLKTTNKGDNSEYFKDCIKGGYIDKTYSFMNNVKVKTLYANIPYVTKNKNKNFNYGYSPIEDINFNNLQTPLNYFFGTTNNLNYDFLDFSQFKQYFDYEPKHLLNNETGTFISQDKILTNNNLNQSKYSAQFETSSIQKFDKNIYSSITIPIKIVLNKPSIGNINLYIQSESFSSAYLGYDFFLTNELNITNQKTITFNFQQGNDTIDDYIIVTDKISTEDTIILSLRNENNQVLDFIILRCEEFVEINEYTDNSYLLTKLVDKNKLFLNCFVDYNYDNDDMEFYRNNDILIINETKTNLTNPGDLNIN